MVHSISQSESLEHELRYLVMHTHTDMTAAFLELCSGRRQLWQDVLWRREAAHKDRCKRYPDALPTSCLW